MRKSFFSKAIVAVGVMASAMALSSVAVFAESKTYTLDTAENAANSFFNVISNAESGYPASATVGSVNYTTAITLTSSLKYEKFISWPGNHSRQVLKIP